MSKIRSDKITCFYTNADSLLNNIDELKLRIENSKRTIDVVGITEVFPNKSRLIPNRSELMIPGYDLFTNGNMDTCQRRVGLYIRTDFAAIALNLGTNCKESIWANVKFSTQDCVNWMHL